MAQEDGCTSCKSQENGAAFVRGAGTPLDLTLESSGLIVFPGLAEDPPRTRGRVTPKSLPMPDGIGGIPPEAQPTAPLRSANLPQVLVPSQPSEVTPASTPIDLHRVKKIFAIQAMNLPGQLRDAMGLSIPNGDPGIYWWMVRPRFEPLGSRLGEVARRRRKKREEDEKRKRDEGGLFAPLSEALAESGHALLNPIDTGGCKWLLTHRWMLTDSLVGPIICRGAICPSLTDDEVEEVLSADYGISRSSLRGRPRSYACDVLCDLMRTHDPFGLNELVTELATTEIFCDLMGNLALRYGL